ncbi:MAG: polyphosphate:AMP phosphotransferase [Gammaproteobacteria bacterium]
MFEAAELGRAVSRAEFARQEPELQTSLLALQQRLRALNVPVIILVSGVEGAGKGGMINRLYKWLDARGLRTYAFWESSDEERERPAYWRFWRVLPERGSVGILLGSWYTEPIVEHVFERCDEDRFERELRQIVEFEQLLTEDGALIIKLWFHISETEQESRLQRDREAGIVGPKLSEYAQLYPRFRAVSERAIRDTDQAIAPWHIVEATDSHYQHLTAGRILQQRMAQHCEQLAQAATPTQPAAATTLEDVPLKAHTHAVAAAQRTILDTVDLKLKADAASYEQGLSVLQERLRRLSWQAKHEGRNTVLVFEGWDAAGKGGVIRRLVAGIDARLFRVISIAAPTDEELAHHYLWRFWRHVPRAGYVTVYDRSWYGRVLVERVEGFSQPQEWERAYPEINAFEEQLTAHGIVLLKFWLHISPEEQLRRFRQREELAWKQYKITDEDWRNREKWQAYEQAVHEMVARTSTQNAPWRLVPAVDKKFARLSVLRQVCEALEAVLASPS